MSQQVKEIMRITKVPSVIKVTSESGRSLSIEWKGGKLVCQGDADSDEAATLLFENLRALLQGFADEQIGSATSQVRADAADLLERELHHARDNGHVLSADSQGVGPGETVPAVRADHLKAVIERLRDQPQRDTRS